ncbi:acyl-CoA dehydrogenase family protein [Domibacillus sp. PGB-M46]|uniref:acyl-CoA dehydrogenase family protein n=1 Tax=Domibacillus sp. PGB-M46 TaxID=2910255 RepID=UPI001F59B657|nr:acyl-CoA dehydrogenase family protein [Domibacillus sp. PGB-M46]MCI2253807.1 acyl-CoA dehydrogenase family protein [Domibacillus sp. PGB-M46]
MNLELTDVQQKTRNAARHFAENIAATFVPQMEAGEFPYALVQKMAEHGLMGLMVPKEYGGAGLDFVSYITAVHELSKVSAAAGVILSVHTSVGTAPILAFGTEEQKNTYIPKLASGKWLGAFCLTEPSSGSDASSLKTTARRDGDAYVLNGSKLFVTNGGAADLYVIFARSEAGITAFIAEKGTPGFLIGKDEKKMGLHGSKTTALTFEDMRLPLQNRLGEEGRGFHIAMSNLDGGRIGIAAQALGIAEAAFEYAKKNRAGIELADMAVSVEAARLLVYRAAYLRAAGQTCGREASMAKLFASKAAVAITSQCISQLAGNGPAERLFRDAKVTEIYEGTSEIQRMVISKHLAKGMGR